MKVIHEDDEVTAPYLSNDLMQSSRLKPFRCLEPLLTADAATCLGLALGDERDANLATGRRISAHRKL